MSLNKPNRINKRKPKKKLVWCDCDKNHISPGGAKCDVCGQKMGRSRNKKEPLYEDEK